MAGSRNTSSTFPRRPPQWVRDATWTETSRDDLVDVLATTLLARILTDPECVNQTDTSPWSDADSCLALPSEASPDAVTERGRGDPAGTRETGRAT